MSPLKPIPYQHGADTGPFIGPMPRNVTYDPNTDTYVATIPISGSIFHQFQDGFVGIVKVQHQRGELEVLMTELGGTMVPDAIEAPFRWQR
ncbi:MAG TPA: hypothetical protein VNF91_01475 [Candidatus Acidoferrum sp.]|nr:hypothetical protein [Candidatus Acidoferrum sp.]